MGISLGLVAIVVFVVALVVAFSSGWWIYLVGPVTGAVGATGASQAANYILVGKEKRKLRALFRRYVDDRVISQILENPNLTLQGEKRHVAVLFSDIFNFTTRSESMAPERLVSHLNRYLSKMVEAIQANHGMIDKFMGDGIMAIFGAPLADDEAEVSAVRAALAMIEALEQLNPQLEQEGIEPIRIGVGIHCGEAIVGNIGSSRRIEYTAIGDVVNTASRIEGLTRKLDGTILASSQVYAAIRHCIPAEFVAEVPVKGKSALIRVYRVR
jgi:adenylate cyclase